MSLRMLTCGRLQDWQQGYLTIEVHPVVVCECELVCYIGKVEVSVVVLVSQFGFHLCSVALKPSGEGTY